MSISLCDTLVLDELVWKGCRNGRYTVKSGYWLTMNEEVKKAEEMEGDSTFWGRVWKLNVHGFRDVILHKHNLLMKHDSDYVMTDFCGWDVEDLLHVVWLPVCC